MAQQRLFFPVYAAAIAKNGFNNFTSIHGLQSIGVTTRFNLDHIFEIGQIAEYQAVENVPDVEVTCEKCLDGGPLIYHLATQQGADASLVGRSTARCSLAISYFGDTQQSASGQPINQVVMSGLFPSSLTYTFPVQGVFTESITLVGNYRKWYSAGPFTYSGGFLNTDTPPSGVQRRLNFMLGSGAQYSVLPTNIPGVSSQGYLLPDSASFFTPRLQSIRTSVNLGRTPLYELGVFIPYFRTVDFPVEVRTDIESFCMAGDLTDAVETGNNVTTQTINMIITDGTRFNLGNQNKCLSITETGGNAQQGGGNRSMTFSYVNFNTLSISSPFDPGAF